MKYYSMCHEAVEGGYTDGDVVFSPSLGDYYQVGMPLSLKGLSVDVVLDKKVRRLTSDFFLTTCGAFFVSENMKKALEEVSVELQFVSACIKYSGGKNTEKQYFFIHANARVSCFDYDRSEYSGKSVVVGKLVANELGADYKVRGVKKLIVDELKTNGLDFFFLDGVIWIDPIVSEFFVRKVESEKLNARFVAIE